MGRSRPASHTRTPRATALRASSPRSATGSRVASPAMTLCVRLTAPVCQTQAWKTDGFLNERKRGVVGGDGRLPPCRTQVLMAQQQPTGTQLPPAAPGPPAPTRRPSARRPHGPSRCRRAHGPAEQRRAPTPRGKRHGPLRYWTGGRGFRDRQKGTTSGQSFSVDCGVFGGDEHSLNEHALRSSFLP